jgi:hypothetical protein
VGTQGITGSQGTQGTIGTSVTGAQGTTGASILGTTNTFSGANTFSSTITGSISGNAATATTATNHYGTGGSYIASSTSGTAYSAAIQVREAGLGGAQGSAIAYAPRLGFHWSNVVASSIVMEANGRIAIVNNPGTSYEAFVCGTLTASNFSGSSSGTNTGDQTTISGNAATATLAANSTLAGGLAVHSSTNNEANKIVRTDGNGYIQAGWINSISGDAGTTAIARVIASNDAYLRYYTLANFTAQVAANGGTWTGSCTGNAATATRATAGSNFYIDNNYGYGIVGAYSSTIFQGVFAMGDSYKLTAGGGISNLYGLTWSYPSAGGIAANLASHGLIVAINGGFASCMSSSIVASANITAYSDERLKTNWKDMPDNFVERLSKVRVGTYDRIDGDRIRQVGVSAQSLRPLMPEAVIEGTDDFKTLKVSYGNAAMASAVELAKEVVSLKEQMAILMDRLNKLENK